MDLSHAKIEGVYLKDRSSGDFTHPDLTPLPLPVYSSGFSSSSLCFTYNSLSASFIVQQYLKIEDRLKELLKESVSHHLKRLTRKVFYFSHIDVKKRGFEIKGSVYLIISP
ncbi:hypothetical protein SO802_012880 [Lithocarpus litseifolius]|uniref:Uncharacterized protein n=1 Tax=Lithocarpus litseifolius TaxID=425828 RepID=A0AAW2D6Q5_9ROSI